MKKRKGEGLGIAIGGGSSDINGGGYAVTEGDGYACTQEGVGIAVRREGWDD